MSARERNSSEGAKLRSSWSSASISGDTFSDISPEYIWARRGASLDAPDQAGLKSRLYDQRVPYQRNLFGLKRIKSRADAADSIIDGSMRCAARAAPSCSARSHSRLTRRGTPPDNA